MKLFSLLLIPTFVLHSVSLAQTSAPVPAMLPKPTGLKVIIETPDTAMYSTASSAENVRVEVAKILLAAGWQPYGEAGDTRYFKRGKVRALVTVGVSAGPDAKTMLTYMAEAMNADIPAPRVGTEIQYSDSTRRLGFNTTQSPDAAAAAYREVLAPAGWTTTMAKPEKIDLDFVTIFRHPTEGMIRLAMRPGEGTLYATATYQTQAEVEAEKAKATAQGEALRSKLAAEASAPLPEFTLSLPKGSTKQLQTKAGISFNLASGAAMAGAQAISAELQTQGWKASQLPVPLVRETGMIELSRDNLRLSIVYIDPGGIPAEITITAPKTALKVR